LNYPDKEVYAVGQDHEELKKFGLMDQLNDEQFYDALIIVTDCGNVERIDDQRYQLGKKIIKIDHHPNATPYGDLS
jgi:phosphoesterase RecJ-like protein